jgi:hypothetical protein
MFPRPAAPAQPDAPAGRWRHAVRHAVAVVVAFATLDDRDTAADTACTPTTLRHAAPEPQASAADRHRPPLRAPTRARRPGSAIARPQDCSTPVAGAQRSRAYSTPGSPR